MPNTRKTYSFLELSCKQVLPFLCLSFIFSCECRSHVAADLQSMFLICSSSLLLLVRSMIYGHFLRYSVCAIVFVSVFLKLRDVQPLLILITDF